MHCKRGMGMRTWPVFALAIGIGVDEAAGFAIQVR
jgi:hypothetical protein